jgi:hypothetical protein
VALGLCILYAGTEGMVNVEERERGFEGRSL